MDGVLISRNFQISLSNLIYYFSKYANFFKWCCFIVHWDTFKSHSFQEIKMFSLHLVLLYISQFGNPQVANISACSWSWCICWRWPSKYFCRHQYCCQLLAVKKTLKCQVQPGRFRNIVSLVKLRFYAAGVQHGYSQSLPISLASPILSLTAFRAWLTHPHPTKWIAQQHQATWRLLRV